MERGSDTYGLVRFGEYYICRAKVHQELFHFIRNNDPESTA